MFRTIYALMIKFCRLTKARSVSSVIYACTRLQHCGISNLTCLSIPMKSRLFAINAINPSGALSHSKCSNSASIMVSINGLICLYRQKQLLRRHQNLYHNPDYVPKPPKEKTHTCHECNRTFAHKGNLIRHLAVHDPDSGHHERVLALKIGRQKKIKYVAGHMKVNLICQS